MSVSMEKDGDHIPDQLIQQLLHGYDALIAEVRVLNEQRREFENKISWAKQQVGPFPALYLTYTSMMNKMLALDL
jgi:hypothetical protein